MSQSAFDRLRLAQPVAVLAAALGGGVAQGASTLPIRVTAGSVRYGGANPTPSTFSGIGNYLYGPSMIVGPSGTMGSDTTNIPAYGIGEASLLQPAARGSTAAQPDAFDHFAQISVNGTFFTQPGDQVDVTTTADGVFVSTLTPLDIGGIETTLDYFMDGSSPTLRVLASLTNTTAGALAAEVLYGGNLGSDQDTRIEASSSGDAAFQQADRWFISSDGSTSDGGDVVQTFVRYGEGNVQAASDTYAVPGTPIPGDNDLDYFTDVWSLSLGAGATQSLMWFVQFSDEATTAQGGTDVFADLDTLSAVGLLATLGGGELATGNIVNWGAGQQVPVPGALWLFGAGLFGLAAARRRNRRG